MSNNGKLLVLKKGMSDAFFRVNFLVPLRSMRDHHLFEYRQRFSLLRRKLSL